jgi:hypothetical protein
MPAREDYENLLANMAADEPPLPVDEADQDEDALVLWSITYKTYRA